MSIPPPSDNPNYFQPQVSISPPPPSASPSSLANLSPSIIITLLILSAIIIVTAFLVLFFRHLNRLPVPCLIRFRHLPASSPPSAATSLRHRTDDSSNTDANNTSSAVLDSLPLFTFSSIVRRSSSSSDSDCAVCLSKFKPPDQLRLLPLCCHAFHAECIDAWLKTNQTCPLCRASIHSSDSDIAALLHPTATGNGSFRLEIGSLSHRHGHTPPEPPENARISYSIGSFDYIVDDDSEIASAVVGDHARSRSVSDKEEAATPQLAVDPRLAEEVAAGRSWLGDYMDRLSATLSSRTLSFRSSRRFFTGSSRRSEAAAGVGEWDLEANRVGEEISELFRWASGV